jgi:hypothetical protein
MAVRDLFRKLPPQISMTLAVVSLSMIVTFSLAFKILSNFKLLFGTLRFPRNYHRAVTSPKIITRSPSMEILLQQPNGYYLDDALSEER